MNPTDTLTLAKILGTAAPTIAILIYLLVHEIRRLRDYTPPKAEGQSYVR